ncbi:MAG: hypothetical protein K2K74_00340, partial [Lachnospiraceae bacterium]|nr:hypothetical protein [Lachnospiraceae bacterium]
MKKLRNSVIAKCVAWLLCIPSIMGTVMLGICLVVGVCDGLWDQTREEAVKDAYEVANAAYSREAFWNRGNSAYTERLRTHGFKYGIVRSDSIAEVDFHDRLSYLETNMTEEELAELDFDQLFLYLFIAKSDGSSTGMPMRYYGNYMDVSELDITSSELSSEDSAWSYLYADRICYDVTKGIVYYRAEGNYYPAQNVSLCYDGGAGKTVYNYTYDFNQMGYKLSYKSPADGTIWAEEYADAEVPVEARAGEAAAWE